MKILRLQAENFKKVEVIDITPQGDIVEITGQNGSGKTSVLDSIVACLGGKDKTEFPMPIKNGQRSATIEIDLGDLLVKRHITENTHKLEVFDKSGEKIKSPQKVIDKFVGRFSFDPMRFYDLKPDQQRIELLGMLGVTEEVTKVNDVIKTYMTNRSAQVAQRNLLNNQLPEPKPVEAKKVEISQDLITQLSQANNTESLRSAEKELCIDINALYSEISTLQKKLGFKEVNLKSVQAKITEAQTEPAVNVEQQIAEITKNNENATVWENYLRTLHNIFDHDNQIAAWDKQITESKAIRDDVIANADMPIKGMSIGSEGLYLNNIPLKQISSADQIKVSVFLAMRLNPDLKVIRIANGSLLDQISKQVIIDLAKKFDYQIWIETVSEDRGIGFFMEEGRVVNEK
jgi:DNA repair exonuclease SbcCD ATPase subunit